MLSGRFDADFWSGIVLQMAHAEPAIRNAMIALADLNQHGTGSLDHARRYATASPRSQFWLYYNRAVRHLVNRMNEPSYTPEVGLVVCLLFVCIGFLRADTQAAIKHLKSGLGIVSELRRHAPISTHQARLARGSISRPLNIIEETLVPVFTQGLISALLYGVDVDTEFAFLGSLPEHSQTHCFASISEARLAYWSLRDAAILLAQNMAIKTFQVTPPSASDLQPQYKILECHRSWFKALLALERLQKLSAEDVIAVNALKVGYYTTYTAISCVYDTGHMSFDAHLDSFKALLVHAKVLIASLYPRRTWSHHDPQPNAAANFAFDTALVPALFYTAQRCRCPDTRREAIALLSQNLPREGLWDPEKHRIVAERIVEIEEKEVDERVWPLKRARLWNGALITNLDKSTGSQINFGVSTRSPSVGEVYMDVPLRHKPGVMHPYPHTDDSCSVQNDYSSLGSLGEMTITHLTPRDHIDAEGQGHGCFLHHRPV
jgi:hypothetical protein